MKCFGSLFLLFCLVFTVGAAEKLQKIVISKDAKGFETKDGKPFVPWGVNYFRPEMGWAPKIWKMFDPSSTRKDFERLRKMGCNCVRVFLTYNEFLTSPDNVNEDGLKKLDEFLTIAEEMGIYVHPTGPDHWEGLPDWAKGDRISDEKVLKALDMFWKTVASRYKGRNVLFAYDLLNEPSVPWNSPQIVQKWNSWIDNRYGGLKKAVEVWQIEYYTISNSIVPPRDSKSLKWLKDYQEFREEVATQWVKRQANAIKQSDPNALVTVGLIQWSIPLFISNPSMYSGFRPSKIAPYLDFMEIHFYPLAGGAYGYQSHEAESKNLAYLEAVVGEIYRCNKPVVLAEYGWYGGGTLPGSKAPAATEEQQAQYCQKLVERSQGWVCGWLHWGVFDHLTAKDVTRYIGLFKSNGEIKEWGKTFEKIGKELPGKRIKPPEKTIPAFPFDSAIIDVSAGRQYFEKYFEQFK